MIYREALVDRIYEAAIIPERWPSVLHEISSIAGCFGGILFTTPAHQITRWTSSDGVRQIMTDFTSDPQLQGDNLRLQRGIAARHHGFFANHHLYSREDMNRSTVYTKFFFPKGLGYAAGTVLPMPNGDIAVFDLERRFQDGPVPDDAIAELDGLRPHLARAAVLAARLHLERARELVGALANAGLPAAILAADGRVLAANQLLEGMAPQIMFLARDRIALSDRGADALFSTALAQLAFASAAKSIPAPAMAERSASVLHILPMSGEASDVFSKGRALLVATQLDRPAAPTAELLSGLFDLTAAEARVARAVVDGRSVEDAAAHLGLSRETVRFYLKSVFGKTGVNRQSDLVALLLGSMLPLHRANV